MRAAQNARAHKTHAHTDRSPEITLQLYPRACIVHRI